MLVVMLFFASMVTSPAFPCSENDWMGWVAFISPCWLVMLMLPPFAVCCESEAAEVIIPVVMFSWAVISIVPAFPVSVLWALMVLLEAVSSPVLMVMVPPAPVPVVSVSI